MFRKLFIIAILLFATPSFSADTTFVDGEGIDSVDSGGSFTVSGEDASSSNKGIATFNTDNFSVSSGDVTIKDNGVILGTETTGNYAGSSSEGGAATTATALAANGSNCSAGFYPLGVDADGAVESCTDASTGGCKTFRGGQFSISGTIATTGDATQGAQIDGSNSQVLLFDASTDEGVGIEWQLPQGWTTHGTTYVPYYMVSATLGTVEGELKVMCQSSGDAESTQADGFGSTVLDSETVPSTVKYPSQLDFTTPDDSCSALDTIKFNFSFDSDDGSNDTATGNRAVRELTYCWS